MMWRKIETWIHETRIEQDNPRFGEWVQWLAERLQEAEPARLCIYSKTTLIRRLRRLFFSILLTLTGPISPVLAT